MRKVINNLSKKSVAEKLRDSPILQETVDKFKVRRSATICMFSKDDKDMLNAKTGDWFITNPQRGRSNNSVMLLRDDVTRDEWAEIMKSVRQVGEPGFIFTDNLEFCYNP